MSFRQLRPSFGEPSALASNPSESTGADPTRNTRSDDNDNPENNNNNASKRRRVPESVTRNACLNCKKARAKCDGKTPCTRCSSRQENSPCIYEIHIKHAKEELVRQIKELRAKNHMTEQILGALSSDEQVPEILMRLKNGDTYDSIVDWLGRAPYEGFSPRSQHSTNLEASDNEMGGMSNFKWTSVTSDSNILEHLFQLYFAWIHPVHTLFSERHFVDSYKRQTLDYCSPALVNAICALACHLHTAEEKDTIDFEQLGVSFSDVVRLSIDPSDKSITTIQAFAVLFLVDCARGRCLRASKYLKIANNGVSRLSVVDGEGFSDVIHETSRGISNLTVEWAQATFESPKTLNLAPIVSTDGNGDAMDDAQWCFYRYVGDQYPALPSLQEKTNKEKAKLMSIISDTTELLYGARTRPIEAQQILQHYGRYVNWREELPSCLGDILENKSQPLPHVLSLLILYSSSVVQLLRPLLDLKELASPIIDEVVWTHTQHGLFLLDRYYRTQYTCRFQGVLQMFATLHLCDMISRFFPSRTDANTKDGQETIRFGLGALMQSRACYPIAGVLQELLRRTAVECSVALPRNLNDLVVSPVRVTQQKPKYRMDDFIDACTRPNYIQPVADILASFGSNFVRDWLAEAARFGFKATANGDLPSLRPQRGESEEEKGAQSLMHISNLLNTN